MHSVLPPNTKCQSTDTFLIPSSNSNDLFELREKIFRTFTTIKNEMVVQDGPQSHYHATIDDIRYHFHLDPDPAALYLYKASSVPLVPPLLASNLLTLLPMHGPPEAQYILLQNAARWLNLTVPELQKKPTSKRLAFLWIYTLLSTETYASQGINELNRYPQFSGQLVGRLAPLNPLRALFVLEQYTMTRGEFQQGWNALCKAFQVSPAPSFVATHIDALAKLFPNSPETASQLDWLVSTLHHHRGVETVTCWLTSIQLTKAQKQKLFAKIRDTSQAKGLPKVASSPLQATSPPESLCEPTSSQTAVTLWQTIESRSTLEKKERQQIKQWQTSFLTYLPEQHFWAALHWLHEHHCFEIFSSPVLLRFCQIGLTIPSERIRPLILSGMQKHLFPLDEHSKELLRLLFHVAPSPLTSPWTKFLKRFLPYDPDQIMDYYLRCEEPLKSAEYLLSHSTNNTSLVTSTIHALIGKKERLDLALHLYQKYQLTKLVLLAALLETVTLTNHPSWQTLAWTTFVEMEPKIRASSPSTDCWVPAATCLALSRDPVLIQKASAQCATLTAHISCPHTCLSVLRLLFQGQCSTSQAPDLSTLWNLCYPLLKEHCHEQRALKQAQEILISLLRCYSNLAIPLAKLLYPEQIPEDILDLLFASLPKIPIEEPQSLIPLIEQTKKQGWNALHLFAAIAPNPSLATLSLSYWKDSLDNNLNFDHQAKNLSTLLQHLKTAAQCKQAESCLTHPKLVLPLKNPPLNALWITFLQRRLTLAQNSTLIATIQALAFMYTHLCRCEPMTDKEYEDLVISAIRLILEVLTVHLNLLKFSLLLHQFFMFRQPHDSTHRIETNPLANLYSLKEEQLEEMAIKVREGTLPPYPLTENFINLYSRIIAQFIQARSCNEDIVIFLVDTIANHLEHLLNFGSPRAITSFKSLFHNFVFSRPPTPNKIYQYLRFRAAELLLKAEGKKIFGRNDLADHFDYKLYLKYEIEVVTTRTASETRSQNVITPLQVAIPHRQKAEIFTKRIAWLLQWNTPYALLKALLMLQTRQKDVLINEYDLVQSCYSQVCALLPSLGHQCVNSRWLFQEALTAFLEILYTIPADHLQRARSNIAPILELFFQHFPQTFDKNHFLPLRILASFMDFAYQQKILHQHPQQLLTIIHSLIPHFKMRPSTEFISHNGDPISHFLNYRLPFDQEKVKQVKDAWLELLKNHPEQAARNYGAALNSAKK